MTSKVPRKSWCAVVRNLYETGGCAVRSMTWLEAMEELVRRGLASPIRGNRWEISGEVASRPDISSLWSAVRNELLSTSKRFCNDDKLSEYDSALLEKNKRPKCRVDCKNGPRPCPWVGCRHHLMLTVSARGTIKSRVGNAIIDIDENLSGETCALDVADEGGHTLEEVGDLLVMSKSEVENIEQVAMTKIKKELAKMNKIDDLSDTSYRVGYARRGNGIVCQSIAGDWEYA